MSKSMTLFCPSLNSDRVLEFKSNIQDWLSASSLQELTESFGSTAPLGSSLEELSRWYLDFSDCWDFRGHQNQAFDQKVGEGARWLLNNDDLTEGQKELALRAALDLGLMDNSVPAKPESDFIWVLGGAKLSCLLRTRLAAQTIQSSHKPPQAVVLLASSRPIGDAERDATKTYSPTAETEYDLFISAAERELHVGNNYHEDRYDDGINPNNSWIVRKYEMNEYDVFIIAAPSSEPDKRRANSADTYEFFFERFRAPEGSSILLSTSQIYVPYQHSEAIRTIAFPHKIYLDTIGFPPEWGGDLQGMNEPTNYLQEIRSTIQSINRFLALYV